MSEEKRYYVYIMASRSLTLYTGVTGDLYYRVLQHKAGEVEGFTKRYHINRLVYYEEFKYIDNAIKREKQIKAWTRAKRLALIKSENPAWQDLAEGWGEPIELQIPRSPSPRNAGLRAARDDNSHRDADVRGSVDNSKPMVESGGDPTTLQIPRSQNKDPEGDPQPVGVARDDNSEKDAGKQETVGDSNHPPEGHDESIKLQIPRSQNQGLEGNRQSLRVARDDNYCRDSGEQKSASASKAATTRNSTRNIA